MGKVRGISVDLDGCFMGLSYINNPQHDVIEANKELLDQIRQSNSNYKSTYVFVGSNRQSISDDKSNAHSTQNGSGYPRVLRIGNYLEAPVDKLLLTDVYNNLPDGETFDQALIFLDAQHHNYDREQYTGITFLEWLHDKSKLTILYAQIHKLTTENRGDDIEFYFYDDRKDILNNLHQFFLTHPNLLPNNTALYLIRYSGPIDANNKKIEPLTNAYEPVCGSGVIDTAYKNTVKKIAAECIESRRFQMMDPTNEFGNLIKNYEDAKASRFLITEVLDCARDYKPSPAPSVSSGWIKAKKGSRSSTIFNISPSCTPKPQKERCLGGSQPNLSNEINFTPSPPPLNSSKLHPYFWTVQPPIQNLQSLLQFGQHRSEEKEEEEDTATTPRPSSHP